MNHDSRGATHTRQIRRCAAAWAVALMLALDAGNSHATTLIWTNGDDCWQSTTAWAPAGSYPDANDNAIFTNAGTYYVRLTNNVSVQSNFFSNAANTLAIVTLDLGGKSLNALYGGTKPGAFTVGDITASTSIVYLASSTAAGKGLNVPARIVVGRYGTGTLIITNGNVSVANTILGNAEGSCGTLVLSGASTIYDNSEQCAVGNSSNIVFCSLVISNSASMDVVSTFRLGCGATQGGSSNCTLLLDTGARLFTHAGPITIGNNGTLTAVSPSYNNTATVQGGAIWNNGNSTFVIGLAAGGGGATGNVLTVGNGGAVINISHLTITDDNTLNMAGGLIDASTSCGGTVQGFGTVLGNGTISSGGSLKPFNSLGQLTFSNSLFLAGGTTTTVQLGSNSSATVVAGRLTLNGRLNVIDSGGFTNGTYTLFTYGTLTDNGMTVGTTPDGNFNYTIDTSTAGAVKLNVTGSEPVPVADFTGSVTNGPEPLDVTFTDASTGTITSRFWNFGDGTTSNTTLTSLAHSYADVGSYDVSLTVTGPGGTNTLSRVGYIIAGNPPPVINGGLTVTNAGVQVGNVAVVVFGDTNVFSVGATDPVGNPLSYQWYFGDGTTNDWPSSNTVEHAYTTNCGPYAASVTISNGVTAVTSNLIIVVACQFNWFQVQPKLNFARTNADSCTVKGAIDLGTNQYSFARRPVTLDIGGAEVSFTLNRRGVVASRFSNFSKPKYNKATGLWKFKATLKKGSWQTPWANYSMINSNIPKPGVLVPELPVTLLLDTQAFMGSTNLHYTATHGVSGAAK